MYRSLKGTRSRKFINKPLDNGQGFSAPCQPAVSGSAGSIRGDHHPNHERIGCAILAKLTYRPNQQIEIAENGTSDLRRLRQHAFAVSI